MPHNPRVVDVSPKVGCSAFAIMVGLLALIMVATTSFHIVPPGHRGVKVTLGRVHTGHMPEGLTWKLPIVTTVKDVPVKQLTTKSKAEVFSSDLQSISIDYNVLYRIPEDKVVDLTTQYSGDPYDTLVEPRIQERLKQITATYRAEDLVKKREEVKSKLVASVTEGLGQLINIVDITITNLDLSDQLEAAIEQKVIREQEALAKRFELEKAEKDAEITIVNAKAEAEGVRIKGEAITSAPQVILLEIAKKWDGKSPQSVVVGEGGANVLLPLK
ncbi:MAG: prohibitin family protein [Candidatus Sumerlaeaceae bacterium]